MLAVTVRADVRSTLMLQSLLCAISFAYAAASTDSDADWLSWGGNLNNTRSVTSSDLVNQDSVRNLSVAWEASVLGAVSSSPYVQGHSVIFPTWAGQVYALDSLTGQVQWQRSVGDYVTSSLCEQAAPSNTSDDVLRTSVSRTTPALAGTDLLVIASSLPTIAVGGLPYVLGTLRFVC